MWTNCFYPLIAAPQSIRALLFQTDGRLFDKEQIAYEPYFSARPGWAEQNPELFWSGLCEACRRLKDKDAEAFDRIVGVGVTTQRNSMINVDQEGRPLRPTIIWLDQRKAQPVFQPAFPINRVIQLIGMDEALAKAQTDGKCNWIRQNQPEIWQKTYKYLQVSGFLNFRLTGNFNDSVASQIGHIPFNYKKMRWCNSWDLAYRLFPVEHSKLPRTVNPGATIGTISKAAAIETGLAEGLPVIACGSDKGCETIGMGVVDTRIASLSFGTTATIQTTSRRYFEPVRFMPPYPAPVPGFYNPEVEIFRGYWMVTWFKNEFAHKEVLEAQAAGTSPEVILNGLLSQAPAGAMGLMVQPYWGPGLKHLAAKGAMIGFGDVHTKAHVYRAVIEGLAYGLLDGMKKIESSGKIRFEGLAASGGASQSDEICQISADIFNLPLVRGKTYETSGLGAAIVTAVGTGLYPDFKTAIARMVSHGQTFQPNPAHRGIYDQLFERVYLKMYAALEPLYREIRDITGYPDSHRL
jgi:sugar (pentulose or hexulose) kinase